VNQESDSLSLFNQVERGTSEGRQQSYRKWGSTPNNYKISFLPRESDAGASELASNVGNCPHVVA